MEADKKLQAERDKSAMIENMADLAKRHEVDLSDALEDIILSLKREEADLINQAGTKRQIEYLMDSYGPNLVIDARLRVEQAIKDDPMATGMVECCECGAQEFREHARRDGQRLLCRDCCPHGVPGK